jgi:hypothetical protein
VILLHRREKFLGCGVHRMRFQEDFGRTAPDDDRARDAVLFLELPDVFAQLHREVILGAALFYVGTAELLDVVLVKNGLHRTDPAQHLPDLAQMLGPKHRGLCRSVIRGVREDVPAAKDHVFEFLERDKVPNQRGAPFGP